MEKRIPELEVIIQNKDIQIALQSQRIHELEANLQLNLPSTSTPKIPPHLPPTSTLENVTEIETRPAEQIIIDVDPSLVCGSSSMEESDFAFATIETEGNHPELDLSFLEDYEEYN